MKEIILIFIVSAIAFSIFLITLIIGLVKKKRKLIINSVFVLLISIATGIIGLYSLTKKAYNKISELSKPRTGMEIYEALLGHPETDCIEILNHQDQTIPQLDYAILLHFKTCPKELKRILAQKEFEFEKIKASEEKNNNEIWFKPEKMGDSILVLKYYDTNGNGQEIYSSKDSTEVYLKDIAE